MRGIGRVVVLAAMAAALTACEVPPGWTPPPPPPPVPSVGCGTSATGQVLEEQRTLDVAGTERWYLLSTPSAHDGVTPVPLVLDFHGLYEGALIHTKMSEYSGIAEEEGFAVAFPNGTGDPVRWNVSVADTNPDLAFVDALLDQLEVDLCIDTSRIYATGLSNGAMFTSVLACTRADRFAAVAPIAGLFDPAGCAPSRPVPMMAVHGTLDPILLFNGGIGSIPGSGLPPPTIPPTDLDGPGYPATAATWAARQGCDPVAVDTSLTDEVLFRDYRCPKGADVWFGIVLGGGHTWPGSAFSQSIASVVGVTTTDFHATRASWFFFEQYPSP